MSKDKRHTKPRLSNDSKVEDIVEKALQTNKPVVECNKAKKFDENKTPYHLSPLKAEEAVAKVFAFGAKKYGDYNYKSGFSYSRLYNAAQRHLRAFWQGEDIDESGEPHLAHAAASIMMLLGQILDDKTDLDDRFKH